MAGPICFPWESWLHGSRTPAHREAFRQDLENRGVDVGSVEQSAKLLFLDAEQTLGRFMVNGRPEWGRFEKFVSAAVRSLGHTAGGRVRAYGEMVGILWTSGEYSAAIKLEEFWNRILGSLAFFAPTRLMFSARNLSIQACTPFYVIIRTSCRETPVNS